MLLCTCSVYSCNQAVDPLSGKSGKILPHRELKQHRIAESAATARKTLILQKVEEDADAAMEAQIEEITTYLASHTLADSVSGPSVHSTQSPLWSWDVEYPSHDLASGSSLPTPSSKSSVSPAQYLIPERQPSSPSHPISYPVRDNAPAQSSLGIHCEEELIHALTDELAPEVQKLLMETSECLECLGSPSSTGPPPPFPLASFLERSATLRLRLEGVRSKSPAVLAAVSPISKKLQRIDSKLKKAEKHWAEELAHISTIETPSYGIPHNTAHHFEPIFGNVNPVLQVTFFLVVTCQVLLGVSRRGCKFMLKTIQYIIQLALLRAGPNLSQRDEKLLSDIPNDIRTTENQFSLKNKHTIYAVCPNSDCHATYKPVFKSNSPIPSYPTQCTHRPFADSPPCGTSLLKPRRIDGHTIYIPLKPFVRFSFKDWLGGLLSRSGFEDKMDAAWTNATQDRNADMCDIFDGDMLKNFNGPDGKHFSCGGKEGEGRYVFSLCVDFFNPLSNKQAGTKKSIGMISLVCLNLPLEMHYKPENMFLFGVIPGPNEPPLACLNHYLTHLVDELLEFWFTGVRFSRTSHCYYGRIAQCALVCVVSDLPAARKINGFAGVGHTQMCTICHCTRRQDDNGDSYISLHHRRTAESIQKLADLYLHAEDEQKQTDTVRQTGVRWSVLHQLPYFDPARFVVVDAMRNLFLGLIQEHYEILGIRLNEKEQIHRTIVINIPEDNFLTSDLERKVLQKTLRLLESPMNHDLRSLRGCDMWTKRLKNSSHLNGLKLICDTLRIDVWNPLPDVACSKKLHKKDYIVAILAWRRNQNESRPIFQSGSILTKADVNQIRTDIQNMSTPSWLTSVPTNLGQPSHGKLKADQWRTLGITYLPISLICMWTRLEDDDDKVPPHLKDLLSVTLSLVSAVIIASSHTTSHDKADQYLGHMSNYLEGLHKIFPTYRFRPNHHMALHLAEYLHLYGPVHSWWTFPFERLIGLLQRIPTNNQNAQLEETISTSFTKASNLRALMLKEGCPAAIKNCHGLFNKFMNPQVKNTLLTDISQFLVDIKDDVPAIDVRATTLIPEPIHKALRIFYLTSPSETPRTAKFLNCFTIKGLTFSTSKRHHGNSSILVRQISSPPVPAIIEDIVQISSGETLFAVRHLLKTTSSDPFEPYRELQASLRSEHLGHQVIIVRPENVDSHFASLQFEWEGSSCVAVISLSQEY